MREEGLLSLGPREFHRVAYTEWGEESNPRVLLCAHGLTRSGRDFDLLAASLQDHYRVVCPDMAGRGQSQWLKHKEDYAYPLYCADVAALLARMRAEQLHWVGTSMGGIIGMLLAAVEGSPIGKLVLNDVGPFIPKAALARISSYVGDDPRWPDREAAERWLREVYAPFGLKSETEWRQIIEHSLRRSEQGDWALSYDPGIVARLKAQPPEDIDLWGVYQAIKCPVLVIRGERSDLLLKDTAERMRERGPRARLVELPGIGHAPSLMTPEQIELVRSFLLEDP